MSERRISARLNPGMSDDARFLALLDVVPEGRRQEWLRRHLTLPGAGARPSAATPDIEEHPARAEGEVVKLEIRLMDEMPDEAAFLNQYDRIPHSRRADWLRSKLFLSAYGEGVGETKVPQQRPPVPLRSTVGVDVRAQLRSMGGGMTAFNEADSVE